jgi:hypothetical protein
MIVFILVIVGVFLFCLVLAILGAVMTHGVGNCHVAIWAGRFHGVLAIIALPTLPLAAVVCVALSY